MPVYEWNGHRPVLPPRGRCWVAEDARIIGRVVLGEDVGVWFGVVARGDIEPIVIGARTNLQEHVVLHTDAGKPLTVGEGVTVGHRALLHGCTIGDNTLVGMGAVVLSGALIGSNCLIGAHALVGEEKVIPDNSVVLGVPGKVVRPVTEAEIAAFRASADRYAARWKTFAGPGFRRID